MSERREPPPRPAPAEGGEGGEPAAPRALERLRDSPFYVLGLRPSEGRLAIEREGRKLLGMLELGLASSASYPTPVGPGLRSADQVRRAMAELADPEKRLAHELWARLDPTPGGGDEPSADPDAELGLEDVTAEPPEDPLRPFPEALSALGWRPR